MTEAEWRDCADPLKLMEFLRGKASGRKRRLVAVACCRHLLDFMPEGCRRAVEVAERCAEGIAPEEQRWEAYVAEGEAYDEAEHIQNHWAGYSAYRAVENPSDYDLPTSWDDDAAGWVVQTASQPRAWHEAGWDEAILRGERSQIVGMIHDIFGNPFRPATIQPSGLIRKDGAASRMAQGISEQQAFDRLPVLADAVEEAGCDNQDITEHLRAPGPHYLGCWALDLILQKR